MSIYKSAPARLSPNGTKLVLGFTLFSFVLFGSLVEGKAAAQDWTNWRGPEQNGVSRETNLVDTWSLLPPKNIAWVSETGGRSTPIILNGRVYLNCRTPDDVNDPVEKVHSREQVVCFDAETGDVIWRDVFNVFQTDIPAPRVGWAAMCGDQETGTVFVHSVSGLFRCYTPEGKVVWERSLAEEFGKISGYGGRTQTPIIDEDRVIVSFLATNWGAEKGPGPKHYYYAFDKRTGDLQWVTAVGGAPEDTNYSVPVVSVIDGQRMLIGGNCDGALYALNARTGKQIWQFRMSKRGLNSSPVVSGNYVYMAHGEDNNDSPEFGRVECIDARGSGDITDTNSVWRVDGVKAGFTALLENNGIVYVMSDLGKLHAYDGQSGTQLWVHNLGTVGKGSPVWADNKIYVMEVNGRVWILKPTREKCETVSEVLLPAAEGVGVDEIYASPAIAGGRVYWVTRDRTICIADPAKTADLGTPQPMAKESAASDEVDLIQLRPYEVIVKPGETVEYTTHAFDSGGHLLWSKPAAELTVDEGLAGFETSAAKLTAPTTDNEKEFAGLVSATIDGRTATARVRMFNPAKVWKWDFEGYQGVQVPPTWVRAFVKLKPFDLDGNTVMAVDGGNKVKGRPSHQVTLGPPDMKNFEIQADVYLLEQRRQLASPGLSNQRYNLTLKGNVGKLEIQSWPAHKRMAKEISFRSDPNVWYTMKMKVETSNGEAKVFGKVWKTGDAEPTEWTIEATDPHANEVGPPGLYFYAQADCYFDNVIVTKLDE